jgi:hypothetical protein
MRATAVFTALPAAQLAFFSKHGYVVIKRAASSNPKLFQALNTEITDYVAQTRGTFYYKTWRFFNSVGTPDHRHSVGLPLTSLTRQVLDESIGSLRTFLDGLLKPDSPLVELSSIITYPGAEQQKLHSDSPWVRGQPLLLSAFVALSHVGIPNGPTCVLDGSHTESAHMDHAVANIPIFYSADGEMCAVEEGSTKSKMADLFQPTNAILDVGDMLVFNTNIFHYGSANVSTTSRALLSFAFQGRAADGTAEKVKGFTHHTHSSMRDSNLSLGSFPPHVASA